MSLLERVYPRVCGEAGVLWAMMDLRAGLSPRVRGSRPPDRRRPPVPGSIPACAGKPSLRRAAETMLWVYPRVCGEATPEPIQRVLHAGLSPRVRGSHGRRLHHDAGDGSIPACAGKPRAPVARGRAHVAGLSPRVRGSQTRRRCHDCQKGSIPACAGKPT